MTGIVLFSALSACLVGLGLYGIVTHPQLLRKIVAFNLLSAGVFLSRDHRPAQRAPRTRRCGGARRRSLLRRRSSPAGHGDHRHRRGLRRNGDGRGASDALSRAHRTNHIPAGCAAPIKGRRRSMIEALPIPAALTPALSSANGLLLALALFLPIVASLAVFLAGGRFGSRVAAGTTPLGLLLAVWIIVAILDSESALTLVVGDWSPPLGIALRADGFSAAMLVTTARRSSNSSTAGSSPDTPSSQWASKASSTRRTTRIRMIWRCSRQDSDSRSSADRPRRERGQTGRFAALQGAAVGCTIGCVRGVA